MRRRQLFFLQAPRPWAPARTRAIPFAQEKLGRPPWLGTPPQGGGFPSASANPHLGFMPCRVLLVARWWPSFLFVGKGVPLKSTKKGCPFVPMATGHLSPFVGHPAIFQSSLTCSCNASRRIVTRCRQHMPALCVPDIRKELPLWVMNLKVPFPHFNRSTAGMFRKPCHGPPRCP